GQRERPPEGSVEDGMLARLSQGWYRPNDRCDREPRVNLDWHRLRAVVLESDDWGLCAWVPDDRAHRALANQPAFRTEAARRCAWRTRGCPGEGRARGAGLLGGRGGEASPPVGRATTGAATPD